MAVSIKADSSQRVGQHTSPGRPGMVCGSSALFSFAVMPVAMHTIDPEVVLSVVGFFFIVGAVTAWRNGGCRGRDLLALGAAALSAAIAAALFASDEMGSIPRGVYLLGGMLVAGAAEYLTWRRPHPAV